jgi:putative hemolysin
MEDILESIVGNIQDEYDDEEEEICACDDGSFLFEGTVSLDEVQKTLGFEIDEEIECDTLGGFVFYLLGTVPAEDENPVTQYQNVSFEVVAMDERRIAKVRARVLQTTPDETEKGEEE